MAEPPVTKMESNAKAMIVHLNGWPGAGKMTIGALLAERLGARFIHNHLLHDVAIACTGLEVPDRWQVYESVRSAAYAALERRPASETFVMTNALCKDNAREEDAWRHVVELAIARQAALVPIVLDLSLEENCRRLQSAERVGKKMTDPDLLRAFVETDEIQKPDVSELLVLDVSALSAEQAADKIHAHIRDVRGALQPATERHLQLK